MKQMRFRVNIEYNGVSPWYVDAYSPETAADKAKLLFNKESQRIVGIGGNRTIQFIQEPKNLEENADNPLFPWTRMGEKSYLAHLKDLPKGATCFDLPHMRHDSRIILIPTSFMRFQMCNILLPECPANKGILWKFDFQDYRHIIVND